MTARVPSSASSILADISGFSADLSHPKGDARLHHRAVDGEVSGGVKPRETIRENLKSAESCTLEVRRRPELNKLLTFSRAYPVSRVAGLPDATETRPPAPPMCRAAVPLSDRAHKESRIGFPVRPE